MGHLEGPGQAVGVKIESSSQEKNLGVLVGVRLDRTRGSPDLPMCWADPQHGQNEEGILPLCLAQVTPHLQSSLQPWVPTQG